MPCHRRVKEAEPSAACCLIGALASARGKFTQSLAPGLQLSRRELGYLVAASMAHFFSPSEEGLATGGADLPVGRRARRPGNFLGNYSGNYVASGHVRPWERWDSVRPHFPRRLVRVQSRRLVINHGATDPCIRSAALTLGDTSGCGVPGTGPTSAAWR